MAIKPASQVTTNDVEMLDTILYSDLDLEVKFSDAISGFKES